MPLIVGRTPLLPFSTIFDVCSADDPYEELRALLRRHPAVLTAICAASPSLCEAAHQWLSDKPYKNKKMPLRILAYVARMSTRTTPFGLFASLGEVHAGAKTTLRLAGGETLRTFTRPDMGWLFTRIDEIEKDASTRLRLHVFTNEAVLKRGGRLYVLNPNLTRATQSRSEYLHEQTPVSLKHTESVEFLRTFARDGALVADCINALAERYAASHEKAERLFGQLWDAGIVLSELRPSPLLDPSTYVFQCMTRAGLPFADVLAEAIKASAIFDRKPVLKRCTADLTSAMEPLRNTTAAADNVLQIDMRHDFVGMLGNSIMDDVSVLGESLFRSAPILELKRYRERFMERYEGTDRIVPLLELVDADFGLGPPEGLTEVRPEPQNSRDFAITSLAARAAREHLLEIALTEDEFNQYLPAISFEDSVFPDSIEIAFTVAARSLSALEKGEYRVAPAAFSASESAGKSLGRFGHVLRNQTMQRFRTLASNANEDEITAELVYAPGARGYNVAVRERLYAYEINFGTFGHSGAVRLPFDDLWVGLDIDRFYIWSQSLQRRVQVREGHAFNTYGLAPNVCRFLSVVGRDRRRGLREFNWGPAANFPCLPRLRHGRTVLSLAAWKRDKSALDASIQESRERIAKWRERWAVSRHVYLCEADRWLPIDLESDVSLALLCDQSRQAASSTLLFKEIYPGVDEMWVTRGLDRHATEFIASYASRPIERAAASVSSPTQRVRYGPGSEWLYVKLYVGANRTETLLTSSIAPLVESLKAKRMVQKWFFLRYADPLPHVRLRFHAEEGSDTAVRDCAIGAFEAWLCDEQIDRYSLDTYDPELERYGGVGAITAAEQLFWIDSEICLNVLATDNGEPTELRIRSAARSFDGIFSAFYAQPGVKEALDEEPGVKLKAQDWTLVKELQCKTPTTPFGDAFHAALTALAQQSISRNPLTRTVSNLHHMHCNRLGLDAKAERRTMNILRRLCLSRIAMAKAKELKADAPSPYATTKNA